MAVVRIKMPNRSTAIEASAAIVDVDGLRRASREIRRAADRPGLIVELTAEEAIRAEDFREHMPRSIRDAFVVAAEDARRLLEYDADTLAQRRGAADRVRARFAELSEQSQRDVDESGAGDDVGDGDDPHGRVVGRSEGDAQPRGEEVDG